MKQPWLFAASIVFAIAFSITTHAADSVVDNATTKRLANLKMGEAMDVDAFPLGQSRTGSVHLERSPVFANDARIVVITDGKTEDVPRSDRIFLRGRSADGTVRVGVVLEADGTFVQGTESGPNGAFVLKGTTDANGALLLSSKTLDETLPPGTQVQYLCGNENLALNAQPTIDVADELRRAAAQAAAPAVVATGPFRTATVALDTDSKFMAVFSNNRVTAVNWIATMFNTMNTMYENDLQVQLLIGKTILRIGAAGDPYTSLGAGAPTTAEMDILANYWQANQNNVPRSFTALLSGAIPSAGGSCSAAGLAWIDQYCEAGFPFSGHTVGSYSVDKICASFAIDSDTHVTSRILGHELGHNFGVDHTHCTDKTSGTAKAATNTIDTCYNVESGCYAGTTLACPAGGAGTIMSYCRVPVNMSTPPACPNQNLLQFHATQINKTLLPNITANMPTCINNFIFFNDFE